jgi:glutathione S-transferase
MIKVMGRRNSANVQKVMWALGELGLDYQREDVGGTFGYPANYPNPNQVVPTIQDGDLTLWESNACVRYLARQYGTGSLWPDDPISLALADQWMEWQRSDYSNAYFPLFQRKIKSNESNDSLKGQIEAAARVYRQLDVHLGHQPYVAGDCLTVGDIPVGTCTYRYMTMEIPRPDLPNVAAWYQRLTERPAFVKHVMIWYGTNSAQWLTEESGNADIQ